MTAEMDSGLRRIIRIVALLNLGYFGIEFAMALAIGSVSLFADSVDFFEDASMNLLIFFAMAWSLRSRARDRACARPRFTEGVARPVSPESRRK